MSANFRERYDNARERRTALAQRMLAYYRSTASYFDEVKSVAPSRPSEEEMTLFDALVRIHGKASTDTRVLELGCGRCESAPKLMEMLGAGQYCAIEASPDAAAFASRMNPRFQVNVGDISQIPYDSDSFDIVFFNYVLEHTCEPDRVLDEAFRVLRPGGLMAMIVPVCDLPWLTPPSLRHKIENPAFMAVHTISSWIHFLKLRYDKSYFSFPLVEDPFILSKPGLAFTPDDDQVYLGSTMELLKYLRSRGCVIEFTTGRDISSYIRNGRRRWVDVARTIAFGVLRTSLCDWNRNHYTSTVTIVARKR